MISLLSIFQRRKRSETIDREGFVQRFHNYQEILRANRDALELMEGLQQKLSGVFLFDRNYLITPIFRLENHLRTIIDQLNLLSDQRYTKLPEVLKRVM